MTAAAVEQPAARSFLLQRVQPAMTGLIDGTFLGGILHTLPFLIPQFHEALIAAVVVIAFELLTLAWRPAPRRLRARVRMSLCPTRDP